MGAKTKVLRLYFCSVYILPPAQLIQNHNAHYHLYTDDTQMYKTVENQIALLTSQFDFLRSNSGWPKISFNSVMAFCLALSGLLILILAVFKRIRPLLVRVEELIPTSVLMLKSNMFVKSS